MATIQDVGLPTAADFADIEVPEFDRKYTKRQGPASMKKSVAGRTFSASGPKADLIARMIFADMGLTRTQMATIAKCSPSRVSEVIWAMEAAVKRGQLVEFPTVPTKPAIEEPADEDIEPEGMTEDEITDVIEGHGAAELNEEIREALEQS